MCAFFLFQPQALDYKCRDYETFTHMKCSEREGEEVRWRDVEWRGGDGGEMGEAEHNHCRIGVFPDQHATVNPPPPLPISLSLSALHLFHSAETHLSVAHKNHCFQSFRSLFIKVAGKDVHSISSVIG